MSEGAHQYSTPSTDPAELRAQVAHTRRELGHTVEELAARADVRARARQRADETRAKLRRRADRARGRRDGVTHTVREHRTALLGAAAAAGTAAVAVGVARERAGRRR